MRTERRRRTLAAAAVIATVAGTAYAQLAITSSPAPTNGMIPASQPGNIVFSVRNTSSGSLDISGFTAQSGNGCGGVTIGRLDMPGTQAVTLAANQQQQFIAQAPAGFASGPADCLWSVDTPNGAAGTIQTSFAIGTSTDADVQPTVMSFGSQYLPGFEIQSLFITSYGSGAPAWASISNTTSTKFSFTGNCTGTTCSCNGTTCNFMLPAANGTASLDVKCQPMFGGDFSQATLDVYEMGTIIGSAFSNTGSGSAYLGSTTLTCDAYGNSIQVTNAPIAIYTQPNTPGTGSAAIASMTTGGVLSGAQITSTDPSFKITDCNSTTCTYPDVALPTSITIECVGTPTQTTATLTVYGTNDGSDVANVTCVSMGGAAVLDVSPTTVDLLQQDVGATVGSSVTIANSGGSPMTNIVIEPSMTNAGDWTVTDCPLAAPCGLDIGSAMTVPVQFHPTAHGDRTSSFTVTANATGSPVTVTLLGTGLGGVMKISEPAGPPYDLDFGTIPRGQPFSRTLTITNTGNKQLTAMVGGEAAPYSLAPATSQTIFPATPFDYTVTCESATPSASNEQTLQVMSDAYLDSSATVNLHCKVADTVVQVMPQQFDFGEVRVGTPTQSLSVTITNPSSASVPAHVTSIALHDPRTGLSVTPAMTDATLQPGESTTATLVLTTMVDADLTGEFLDINVDSAMLSLPVTGKVVTPKSRIVPSDGLDLGTACVGTQVSGDVMLINEGTATLQASAPMVGTGFLTAGPPGTMYPSSLAPMSSLTTSVSPSMSAVGKLSSTLTWADDVPSMYSLPIKLEYVSSGTAISPALLDFGSVAVDAAALPQHITIENCDLTPTTVTIKSITTQSSPVGAWVLEPRLGYTKMLPGGEKQAITVQFRPPGRGRYEADLDIVTSIGTKRIHLRGDATGRDFDNTSFYACACESPVSPAHGWPIAAAIVLIIVRRRRGSSSAR